MRSRLFILFFTFFIVFNSFGQEEEVIDEEQTEELSDLDDWDEYAEEEEDAEEQPQTLTKAQEERKKAEERKKIEERKRIEENTERIARQIVKEKFNEIDKQKKIQEQEEKRRKKMEKKGKDEPSKMDREEEPKKETRKERKLREKQERELDEQEEKKSYKGYNRESDDSEYDSEYDYGYEYDYQEEEKPTVDSVLLEKRVAELESEMRNKRDFKSAKKGKEGNRILKIKVPNCYYLNSVVYKRGDLEFTYQFDFFVHYFEHRYHHRRKFYNMKDPEREIAKKVMTLVGNTVYRKTNFNEVIDSIGVLLGHSVEELLDTIITELNLEYLATGEIKINYKKRNQTKMYVRLKPSDMENRTLGNITFYTRNKKRVIEELDASQYDSYLPPPEEIYTDSLLNPKMDLSSDSLLMKNDSLSLSLPVNNTIKISLDANKDTLTSKGNEVKEGEKQQVKEVILQPEKVEPEKEEQQGKEVALPPEKVEPVIPADTKEEEKVEEDLHEKEKDVLNENTE